MMGSLSPDEINSVLYKMPELPEVETVRRGLAPYMEGQVIVRVEQRRPNLRFPFPENFCARLEEHALVAMGRRAKYLVADIEGGDALVMHLGMSGSFRVEFEDDGTVPGTFHHERGKSEAHDHVIFHMGNGARVIYNDPRRFGFMDLIARKDLGTCKHFKTMGLEPTGNAMSADYIAGCFKDKKTPLKAALLDQRYIAGLGNIYVCEALWRAGLSPERKAGSLTTKAGRASARLERLTVAIRDVIFEAIEAGGSSLRDYVHTDGSLGYFQHSFAVYDQENKPCRKDSCKGTIARITQSGRSSFYCPNCQK